MSMNKLIVFSLAVGLVAISLLSAQAFAAPPADKGKPSGGGGGKASTPLGIDVSWPQCGKKLPTDFAFAIVGVNGGLASTPNECLADQLAWAHENAEGGTKQPNVQLYVNTANPVEHIGEKGFVTWPQNNDLLARTDDTNPYGTCDGTNTAACIWMYGYERAYHDVNVIFADAAKAAKVDADPTRYTWWLDIEMENSWLYGNTEADHKQNIAALEGMKTYFETAGIENIGLYAYGPHWQQLFGTQEGQYNSLAGLPNWRPGGASQDTAQAACDARPLTTDGEVVLTQYVFKNLDRNISCIG